MAGECFYRQGLADPGDASGLSQLFIANFGGIAQAGDASQLAQSSYISAGRISQVFEQAEEDVLQELVQETALPNQAIKVQQVSFSYPNAASPALTGLTFDLKEVRLWGLFGGTGSGKSTLVQLIPRFYDVTLGKLRSMVLM